MTINLTLPTTLESDFKPRITVIGVGGAGGNAVNNMIHFGLEGVDFLVANSDAQALANSKAERHIQLGMATTHGLGAGSNPAVGRAAAEESQEEIFDHLQDCNMVFITAGLGGGTGTGAAPVIARMTRESGILTVGVVTKPFHFEGAKRMQIAEQGLEELQHYVDTLLIIPNQHLFRVANEKTTFADAFKMADDVLYSGVRGITDLMIMPGLINLDFSDIRAIMGEMGKAMMGSGEAEGEKRAIDAAEMAINNPLLDDVSMKGAKGVLINITAGEDLTLFEVDEAANRIRDEVDENANIIFGSTFDESLEGKIRVSLVATGVDASASCAEPTVRDLADPDPAPAMVERAEPRLVPELRTETAAAPPVAMFSPSLNTEAPAQTAANKEMVLQDKVSAKEGADVSSMPPQAMPPQAMPPQVTPQVTPQTVPQKTVPKPRSMLRDAFIPAPPTSTRTGRAEKPMADPFAAADMINTGRERPEDAPKRKSGLSLFERVTGVARGIGPAKPQATDPAASGSQEQSGPTAKSAAENLLGPVEPAERINDQREEEDLLDIPAFLRRQAN